MPKHIAIKVPSLGVNDKNATIVEYEIEEGAFVSEGDHIGVVETTKTAFDVIAPADGHLLLLYEEGEEVEVDQAIALLVGGEVDVQLAKQEFMEGQSGNETVSRITITQKAEIKAKEYGISVEDLEKVSDGLIRERDVDRVIQQQKLNRSVQGGNDVEVDFSQYENPIVVLGGGGHGQMCMDIVFQNKDYQIVGILDPNLVAGTKVQGVAVLGDDSLLPALKERGLKYLINGVGSVKNNQFRDKLYTNACQLGFEFPALIHPSSNIEPSASVANGVQVMMGAMIGSNATIKENVIVNSGSIISHDSVVEEGAHIAPGAVLAGDVSVGRRSLVGMGVTVMFGINIGSDAVILNGVNLFTEVGANQVIKFTV